MNQRPGYGDAEAKRIIARAAEIDAEQARQLDAPTIREIAAEAGISPLAVDRALQEHESRVATQQVSWLKRHRTMVITMTAIVVLFLFFVVARTVPPHP